MHLNSVTFAIIGIFYIKTLTMNHIFTMNFSDVSIVSIKGSDYRINFCYMSKDDAVSIMNNFNLNQKRGVLFIFLLYIKNE